jgi:hypothetical protein
MDELKVTPQQRRLLFRTAVQPSYISGRSVREFMFRATPEEQEEFLRAQH